MGSSARCIDAKERRGAALQRHGIAFKHLYIVPLSTDLSGFLRQRTTAYTHDSYAQSYYSTVRGQNNLKESSVFPSWSL